jgi:hypothetical protein
MYYNYHNLSPGQESSPIPSEYELQKQCSDNMRYLRKTTTLKNNGDVFVIRPSVSLISKTKRGVIIAFDTKSL